VYFGQDAVPSNLVEQLGCRRVGLAQPSRPGVLDRDSNDGEHATRA
jgi:hypothetical protein